MRSGHRTALLAVISCLTVASLRATTNTDARVLATFTNEFALDVYSQLATKYRAFAFSPSSVATVFAMAYEGAHGPTQREIQRIFRFDPGTTKRRSSYAALLNYSSANAAWTQANRNISGSYLNRVFRLFSAPRTPVDFDRGAWFAKRDIDRWIEVKTNGEISARESSTHTRVTQLNGLANELALNHIPDSLSAPSLSVDIGAHPQRGVYMSRAHLLLRFKDNTKVSQANEALSTAGLEIVGGIPKLGYLVVGVRDDGTFGPLDAALNRLKSNPVVENVAESPVLGADVLDGQHLEELNGRLVLSNATYVKGQFGARNNYAQLEGHRFVELLSDTNDVSLVLMTPKDGNFAELERGLTVEKLNGWIRKLAPTSARTAIPRLNIHTTYSLRWALEGLGMSAAFSDAADFAGISRGNKSLLQAVAHRTAINVTTEGIEAAAATLAGGSVAEPREPSVNMPVTGPAVVFLVRDRTTGMILLMGRMYMPPS